ncbi:hypothetical protein B0H13DRAFT_1887921 [Mycena leptocephala]|nr:hypothetical protein B0H13DRAFT_1887921 [Mycena leptocephala]
MGWWAIFFFQVGRRRVRVVQNGRRASLESWEENWGVFAPYVPDSAPLFHFLKLGAGRVPISVRALDNSGQGRLDIWAGSAGREGLSFPHAVLPFGGVWGFEPPPVPTPTAPFPPPSRRTHALRARLLSWFPDTLAAPFGVHRMALAGKAVGKDVGMWFGPSAAAGALRTLVDAFPAAGLSVSVATDGTLYQTEQRGEGRARKGWGDRPVLLLLEIRLGLEDVNPIYYEMIKLLYTFPQSVGIADGRPSSSYYFVAVFTIQLRGPASRCAARLSTRRYSKNSNFTASPLHSCLMADLIGLIASVLQLVETVAKARKYTRTSAMH